MVFKKEKEWRKSQDMGRWPRPLPGSSGQAVGDWLAGLTSGEEELQDHLADELCFAKGTTDTNPGEKNRAITALGKQKLI